MDGDVVTKGRRPAEAAPGGRGPASRSAGARSSAEAPCADDAGRSSVPAPEAEAEAEAEVEAAEAAAAARAWQAVGCASPSAS